MATGKLYLNGQEITPEQGVSQVASDTQDPTDPTVTSPGRCSTPAARTQVARRRRPRRRPAVRPPRAVRRTAATRGSSSTQNSTKQSTDPGGGGGGSAPPPSTDPNSGGYKGPGQNPGTQAPPGSTGGGDGTATTGPTDPGSLGVGKTPGDITGVQTTDLTDTQLAALLRYMHGVWPSPRRYDHGAAERVIQQAAELESQHPNWHFDDGWFQALFAVDSIPSLKAWDDQSIA